IVGFVTAAWTSTQSRVPEYAVARALGVSRGSIRGWLALEQAFPAIAGLAWGFVLGLGLEWLVLPAVIHAPGGGLPMPAALVVVPGPVVIAYVGAAVVLLVLIAAVLSRSVERAGLVEPLRGEP
ncbi:MAG TPA: ABC transporter permease, partial [Candidatus Limnocylindrales bacterium]